MKLIGANSMNIEKEKNLGQMWDNLSLTYGNKKALIFEDINGNVKEYSYKNLNNEINKAANLFLSFGVNKGDKVSIHLQNSPELLISWFALSKIGAIMVPINANYLYTECSYIIEKCNPKIVVTEKKFLNIYKRIQEDNNNSVKEILIARDDTYKNDNYVNFNNELKHQSIVINKHVDVNSDDISEILFTSGTTSFPKGVVITHYNMLFAGPYTSWQGSINENDIYLTVMPAWHIDSQCTATLPAFSSGATLVFLEKYSARKFWKQVCKYNATITECIPKIMCTLLMQPIEEWEKSHSLREVFYYLTTSEEEKNAFIERFDVRLLTSYGMTETIVGLIGDRPNEERRWPSLGKVGIGYEAKIIDSNGNEVNPYVHGEIYVKGIPGKTIFKEYYNDLEATKKALSSDGWLHTGDIGYMDKDKYFYFVDRQSNLIKNSGENVSSEALENFLSSHPKIVEAGVIGIADKVCCEVIKAFVVIKEGEDFSKDEIIEYCSANLASFKVPSVIEKLTTLPRTSTGKIRKNILKNKKEKGI